MCIDTHLSFQLHLQYSLHEHPSPFGRWIRTCNNYFFTSFREYSLRYFMRGSITVRLTSCSTGLGSIKEVKPTRGKILKLFIC